MLKKNTVEKTSKQLRYRRIFPITNLSRVDNMGSDTMHQKCVLDYYRAEIENQEDF